MTNPNNNSLTCCPLGAPELCASTKKPDPSQGTLESDRKSGSWADDGDPEVSKDDFPYSTRITVALIDSKQIIDDCKILELYNFAYYRTF